MEKRFLICEHCGNIIAMIRDKGVAVQCCGEKMKEILSGANTAAEEKHVPVYDVKNGKVTVTIGAVEHPMVPEHYIEWVCLETEDGIQYKQLQPNTPPEVSFFISPNDKVKA
ncbi:MAG: desulfoferrodoxin family protein, partial [Acutalibacteraceae bacterium]|nr:desulfoferrodoxin family protein [Acutalibacteraceae bacterium]